MPFELRSPLALSILTLAACGGAPTPAPAPNTLAVTAPTAAASIDAPVPTIASATP